LKHLFVFFELIKRFVAGHRVQANEATTGSAAKLEPVFDVEARFYFSMDRIESFFEAEA
jgi:hypothetical protein